MGKYVKICTIYKYMDEKTVQKNACLWENILGKIMVISYNKIVFYHTLSKNAFICQG